MSERTSYEPGTPSWVDLSTRDIDAAEKFYGDVLGWQVPEMPNSAEMGGYRRAKSNGADVAGVLPLMAEGQPPVWSTYIAVADADATATAVTDNGGSVIAAPMDVMDLGRLAVFADPTGAVFGVWQAGTFAGAAKVNEPGAIAWNELNTRDIEAARNFYAEVFGWFFREWEMKRDGDDADGPPRMYTELLLNDGDEESIGGMLDMSGMVPDAVPPHWLTYFAVEDTDAALEKIEGGGGSVMFGPVDIPAGRFAAVADPDGASFAVIQLPK